VGRSTLVVGRSGTGKTIFGLQAASSMARNGIKAIVIGIEESADDLLATGDALGFNLSGLSHRCRTSGKRAARRVRIRKRHCLHVTRPHTPSERRTYRGMS